MDTVGKTVFSKASSPSPVEKTGMMVKLGWNKTVLGADSWQLRYFRLTATGLSYAKGPDAPIIDNIVLHKTVDCNLVEAGTAARRNRWVLFLQTLAGSASSSTLHTDTKTTTLETHVQTW
jgi:hypothetical protein